MRTFHFITNECCVFLLLLGLVFTPLSNNAQEHYTSAIGLKTGGYGGAYGGLNFKHFATNQIVLDFTLGGGTRHLRGDFLFEIQRPIKWTKSLDWSSRGLDWYFGIGGAIGTWRRPYQELGLRRGFYTLGKVVVGLDYDLSYIAGPVIIFCEIGPHIGLYNAVKRGIGGAVGMRYILK